MKIASAVSFLAVAGSATAFAPSKLGADVASTALRMSDDSTVKEKVPLTGAAPMFGSETGVFVGENYWDKLTMEYGSEDTGKYLRAAEIKHGRSAMLATVGYAFQKMGITFDRISPHEYLSISKDIKFADLAAMGPIDAFKAIPIEGLAQIFMAIAAVEIYELTHRDGEIKTGEPIAPGLRSGGLTGDLGFNPLGIKITERRKLVELQNGRAAMFAICAWVAAEAVPGSVPLSLPW